MLLILKNRMQKILVTIIGEHSQKLLKIEERYRRHSFYYLGRN